MSVKIMGQVWDLDLPANKLLVLLAMTDHADHNGDNIHPSMELIAWKTGYSERQVRRIVQGLVKDKVLIAEKRPGKTTLFTARIENGKQKEPFKRSSTVGQNVTPDIAVSGQVGHSHVLTTPDTQMSDEPSVKPSNNHHTRQPDLIYDAISQVWKTNASGVIVKMKSMMLGTAKGGEWSDSNFDIPVTADEIISFGQWYKRKNPDLTIPGKPEKIQRWFYEYRAAAAKKIMPLDPAQDLSIAVDFDPILLSQSKAVNS